MVSEAPTCGIAATSRRPSPPWYRSPTPAVRNCPSVPAKAGCTSISPSPSGRPFLKKMPAASGSAASGPATTSRSRTKAREAGTPKRASCSAGETSDWKDSRPNRACSRYSPRASIGTAAGRSAPAAVAGAGGVNSTACGGLALPAV